MTTDEATELAARLSEVPGLTATVQEDGTLALDASFGAKIVAGEEGKGLGDAPAERVEVNLRMALLQQWANIMGPMAQKEMAGKVVVASDVPKDGGKILRPGGGTWGKGGAE